MKLRFPFPLQQLLSATIAVFLLGAAAQAQDVIVLSSGAIQQGKVLGVTPTGSVDFQVGGTTNKVGFQLNQIREVRMAAPSEYAQGVAAYGAKDYPKSLNLIRGLVDKYKGLPTAWAQQATSLVGELYIQTNDLAKAEAAYNDFKRFYPAGGSMQSDVGLSRLAIAKKDFAPAKAKLEPITEAALKEKVVPPANALAYSQAFLVSGQAKEAEGDFAGALEDYLRTVTVFYHDRTAVATAQEKADALRKAHAEITAP